METECLSSLLDAALLFAVRLFRQLERRARMALNGRAEGSDERHLHVDESVHAVYDTASSVPMIEENAG